MRTEKLRTADGLFIIMKKPHNKATTQTITRWVTKSIQMSGQQGTGGSTRSTSTSHALSRGVSLDSVIKSGDWSRVGTFKKYYYKPVPLDDLQDALHIE